MLQQATSCAQSQGLGLAIHTHSVTESTRSLPLPPCVCRTYGYINYSAPRLPRGIKFSTSMRPVSDQFSENATALM